MAGKYKDFFVEKDKNLDKIAENLCTLISAGLVKHDSDGNETNEEVYGCDLCPAKKYCSPTTDGMKEWLNSQSKEDFYEEIA